ncbi:hypothetical protein FM038_022235 [Shewanella eurypsychrophilus]|uniref:TM2 domain-containing protein n=1 Tax=Shewanella eurypsychrophilus TaxID=2593656 RepID=A0ABX6VAT1_9GAMM|nr:MULTISPECIES: hypothetical protein [Shewanella]QFU24586.1 hypothetical protein FS418_23910 [Shewanella sp. YLB-09]QPG59783.1 hypothetical protein FM038_022235 [Shewanella eurypsychrophilus]
MKKAITASLLSAFVCPGAGHFYLKKYNIGTLISAVSLTGLVYLLYQAVERAREISDQILSGAVPLDIEIITRLVTQPPANAQYVTLATWVFILGWAVGIFDAYRQGHALDKKEEKAEEL